MTDVCPAAALRRALLVGRVGVWHGGVRLVDRPRIMLPPLRAGLRLLNVIPASLSACRRKASELATAVDFVAAGRQTQSERL